MKVVKITLMILGATILAIFLIGHIPAEGADSPITIGILENQDYAYAAMMRNSFALALESINARGAIKGRPLRLVYADDGGDKSAGVEAVRTLVKKHKAVMLTGGYSSSNALFMAQTAEALDVPFLVSTAADDRITQHHHKNIYRLNPPASEYANGLENLLESRLRPSSMAIVYENSPFGTGGATRMMWFCRERNISIKAIIPYHKERAAPDYFSRIIAPLAGDPPDAVYMVSYLNDGVLLVNQIRAARIHSQLLGGAGGFTHPDFISRTGDASRFMLTATLWTADLQYPLAVQYAQRYRSKYNQTPDYHGAEAFSSLVVIADALRRAESLDAESIRQALNRTRMDTPFGRIAFETTGRYQRQNSQPTLVLQAIDGQYACVWPRRVSVADLILPVPGRPRTTGVREASLQ